jgi:membrane protease YdiL (CAAX protease family)
MRGGGLGDLDPVLLLECLLLFGAAPFLLLQGASPWRRIAVLWVAAVAAGYLLYHDPSFDLTNFGNIHPFFGQMRGLLQRMLVGFAVLAVTAWFFAPSRFLDLPRRRPGRWFATVAGYAVFLAYPQELIFRGFFFQRYADWFPAPWWLAGASALAFAVVFGLWRGRLAAVAGLVGGCALAYTYSQSQSLALVSLEHAGYGAAWITFGMSEVFELPSGRRVRRPAS